MSLSRDSFLVVGSIFCLSEFVQLIKFLFCENLAQEFHQLNLGFFELAPSFGCDGVVPANLAADDLAGALQ